MSNVRTRLILEGDNLSVNRVQDIEPTLEWAKERAKESNSRGDMREKWTLPPVEVEKLYIRYTGQNPAAPMDQEFWMWVDQKVMTEEYYAPFRLGNKSNPFFLGYK